MAEQTHHCIACDYPVTYPLFHPEDQPLSALNLPKSEAEAKARPAHPMDFHTCANCGHIFNVQFDYSVIPYDEDSNLMYNAGAGWQRFMQEYLQDVSTRHDLDKTTWIDIGCGDGHFLLRAKEIFDDVKVMGYEPGIEADNANKAGVECFRDYFVAERDLPKHKPDVLACRHVIEHLDCPKDFVADIAYWCNMHDSFPLFIAEVPRIDKAIAHNRINDYLYEHVSNFTERSFRTMFEVAGYEVLHIQAGYNDEVVVIEARAKKLPHLKEIKARHTRYKEGIEALDTDVQVKVMNLIAGGKTIAFWGGTGKGASFLNNFHLPVEDFPIVVDSDYNKCGKFVPGMGQELRPPEYLEEQPTDMIVITTQWRAKDIYEEIKRRNIAYENLYVLHGRELIQYEGEML